LVLLNKNGNWNQVCIKPFKKKLFGNYNFPADLKWKYA
jgi:hypothetical protein